MRISDWSSDVCSSDLEVEFLNARLVGGDRRTLHADAVFLDRMRRIDRDLIVGLVALLDREVVIFEPDIEIGLDQALANPRSEEHTSELQSLMRISYAVFCLKKKKSYLYHNLTQ